MQLSINTINFQSKIRTTPIKKAVSAVTNSTAAAPIAVLKTTHFYTPRRSEAAVKQDIEVLRLTLQAAAKRGETLSRKEVACRAGITPHQLNNMINTGKLDSEILALYDKVKIRNPEKFIPLPDNEASSRIIAIRKGIEALAASGQEITGEKIAEITGISVHKVRRMLANDTAGLNTYKKLMIK